MQRHMRQVSNFHIEGSGIGANPLLIKNYEHMNSYGYAFDKSTLIGSE